MENEVHRNIVTAERKKGDAWVELGRERRSPDPTRPDSTQASYVFHSIATMVSTISLRFLQNECLEKTSDNGPANLRKIH